MITNSIELKSKLRSLKDEMLSLHTTSEKEDRGFNADEQAKWDKMTSDAESLKSRITRAEQLEADTKASLQMAEELGDIEDRSAHRQKLGDGPTYDAVFAKYLRSGESGLKAEERTVLRKGYINSDGETRTNVVGTTTLGGYTVNETFGDRIIASMKRANGFMDHAQIFRTATGAPFSMPTIDETANIGERLGENIAANKQNLGFGTFTMAAHKYGSGIIELSEELIQDNSYDLESRIAGWAGARIGRITNSDMTIGHAGATHIGPVNTGLAQTATASGVTTAVNTITYDKLVDLIKSLNPAYVGKDISKFCMSDVTEGLLMKMKDTQNRPLWLPSTREGVPDKVLGYEYFVSDFMPEADTLGNIYMLFGDFSKYLIRICKDITVKRSIEYAWARDTIAYHATMRVDAKLEDAAAIKSLAVV